MHPVHTLNVIVPEDPFFPLYEECIVICGDQAGNWLQDQVEVVEQPLFVWEGLCVCGRVWTIFFGRLCVVCPSCLCCHGDSFIFKPEHVSGHFLWMCACACKFHCCITTGFGKTDLLQGLTGEHGEHCALKSQNKRQQTMWDERAKLLCVRVAFCHSARG